MTAVLTLDEEMLHGLTPMEERNGRWYKRDDLLAFSNGVSGKVRTSLWLGRQAINAGADRLVYGGSVKAPALGRVASAANYLGLKSTIVIGTDPVRAAERNPTVAVAAEAGADFDQAPVAYNPALQKRVREIVEASNGKAFQVPYGVSAPLPQKPVDLQRFLEVDGKQVLSLAEAPEVDTLVMSFGSANAASGVFWGLHTYPEIAAQLKRVVLVGVGPDKRDWFRDHLRFAGVKLDELGPEIEFLPTYPHFAQYTDRMPETRDGIDFHELYEGKVVRFLDLLEPDWWTARDGTTCFWIVGGPLP